MTEFAAYNAAIDAERYGKNTTKERRYVSLAGISIVAVIILVLSVQLFKELHTLSIAQYKSSQCELIAAQGDGFYSCPVEAN